MGFSAHKSIAVERGKINTLTPEPGVLSDTNSLDRDDLSGRFMARLGEKLAGHKGIVALAGTLALAASVSNIRAEADSGGNNTPLTSSSTKVSMAPPLEHVGYVEPELFTTDWNKAKQVAKLVRQAGANAVKIFVNVSPTENGYINNDYPAFCNAAGAAQKEGLNFTATFLWMRNSEGVPETPTTSSEIKSVITTALAYENALAGEKSPGSTTGIVGSKVYRCPTLPNKMINFSFGLGNEWNLSTFTMPQFDNAGNWVAPLNMVRLYSKAYAPLKKHARTLGANLSLDAADLASDKNDLLFIKKMGEAISKLGVSRPIFDSFNWHPYVENGLPTDKHPNGEIIGVSDVDQLASALTNALGYTPDIGEGEWGVESKVPPDKQHAYNVQPQGFPTVDENAQGWQYNEALSILACSYEMRVKDVFFFHAIDDPGSITPNGQVNTLTRTGIYYPDGTEKTDSFNRVRDSNRQALNGKLVNCNTLSITPFTPVSLNLAKESSGSVPTNRQVTDKNKGSRPLQPSRK